MAKKQKKLGLKYLKPWIISSSIALVCLSFIGIYFFTSQFSPNPNLYEGNKEVSRSEAQAILDKLELPGIPLYNKVRDLGCDNRSAGYFQLSYTCELIAQKYTKSTGEPKTTFIGVDQSLQTLGFIPDKNNAFIDNSDDFNPRLIYTKQSLGHSSNIQVDYTTPQKHASSIEELFRTGEIPAMTGEDFIIGFSFQTTYFACSGRPCPQPPEPLLIRDY